MGGGRSRGGLSGLRAGRPGDALSYTGGRVPQLRRVAPASGAEPGRMVRAPHDPVPRSAAPRAFRAALLRRGAPALVRGAARAGRGDHLRSGGLEAGPTPVWPTPLFP